MTKNKMNELFEKSQEIINIMNELGIKEYHGYSIMETVVGNFLILDGIPITPYFIDSYIDENLSKFMPKTSIEIIDKFERDVENNLFSELYNSYALFIEKC